jgi:hypothetical protein
LTLTSTSSEEDIVKLFDSIEQRIRARCKQYLHSQRAEDNADEEKAAMFQVEQARPTQPPPQTQQSHQPQQPRQPQHYDNERKKRDRCFFCGLMGHRMNECLDYRHLQALQRKQRQEQRRQVHSAIMPHDHQMQGSQIGHSRQTPYEPLQLRPMANAVGYQQSQGGVSPGSHA